MQIELLHDGGLVKLHGLHRYPQKVRDVFRALPLGDQKAAPMIRTNNPVDDAIVEASQRTGSCCLDDLVMQLPNHAWNEIFGTVDRMSRDERLTLPQLSRSGYQLSLAVRHADNEVSHGPHTSAFLCRMWVPL